MPHSILYKEIHRASPQFKNSHCGEWALMDLLLDKTHHFPSPGRYVGKLKCGPLRIAWGLLEAAKTSSNCSLSSTFWRCFWIGPVLFGSCQESFKLNSGGAELGCSVHFPLLSKKPSGDIMLQQFLFFLLKRKKGGKEFTWKEILMYLHFSTEWGKKTEEAKLRGGMMIY